MAHRLQPEDTTDRLMQPCPFCGGTDLDIEETQGYYLICHACGARGPDGCTNLHAVDLWQSRWRDEPPDA